MYGPVKDKFDILHNRAFESHAEVAMLSPSANAYGSKGFPSRGAFSPQSKKRNETFCSELCRATDDAKTKATAEVAVAKEGRTREVADGATPR